MMKRVLLVLVVLVGLTACAMPECDDREGGIGGTGDCTPTTLE